MANKNVGGNVPNEIKIQNAGSQNRKESPTDGQSDGRTNGQLKEGYEAERKYAEGFPQTCNKIEQKEEQEKQAEFC